MSSFAFMCNSWLNSTLLALVGEKDQNPASRRLRNCADRCNKEKEQTSGRLDLHALLLP
jgi:hypothetical protein